MKISLVCLSGTRTRSRTHLFSLPQTPETSSSIRSSPSSRPRSVAVETNPYLRILNSSLRRCLLTQKVLPIHMLIPLRQLSLPPSTSPSSSPPPKKSRSSDGGMVLLPKGIQHSRFEEKVGGKGSWVLCHSLALEQLATKGSFKRINTALSMPKDLKSLREYTEYQLVKRVEQEIEMYCERAKSWRTLIGVEGFEPIRRVGDMKDVEKEGHRVEMALDLSSHGEEDGKIVEWIRVRRGGEGEGEREVPVWKIGGVVRRVVVPPQKTTSSHTSSGLQSEETATASDPVKAPGVGHGETSTEEDLDSQDSTIQVAGSPVLDLMKCHLDLTISLFHRRRARLTSAALAVDSAFTTIKTNQDLASRINIEGQGGGEMYVCYSPAIPSESVIEEEQEREVIGRMKKDLVDLWIACWRIGLWKGEGWEA
ncbi:hypothetical protein JCM5353_005862 [Sporobolomyces roseus]